MNLSYSAEGENENLSRPLMWTTRLLGKVENSRKILRNSMPTFHCVFACVWIWRSIFAVWWFSRLVCELFFWEVARHARRCVKFNAWLLFIWQKRIGFSFKFLQKKKNVNMLRIRYVSSIFCLRFEIRNRIALSAFFHFYRRVKRC